MLRAVLQQCLEWPVMTCFYSWMTRKLYFFQYKLYAGDPGFKGSELLGALHFSEHMASLVCCMVVASNLREVVGTNLKNATI